MKVLKQLLVLSILILATTIASAQDPTFTQFYSNPIYLNPAFAGSHGCPRFNLNYRNELLTQEKEVLIEFILKKNSNNIQFDLSTHKRCIRALEILTFLEKNTDFSVQTEQLSFNSIVFGLHPDRETRRTRISTRLKSRFEEGMLKEVKNLLANGVPSETLKYYGLEYKLITEYLENQFSYNEMLVKLETAIHQYAKRQMTFFRKMEKDGVEINWLDDFLNQDEKIDAILKRANL